MKRQRRRHNHDAQVGQIYSDQAKAKWVRFQPTLTHNDCPRGNSITTAHITCSQTYQITRAQFTVDAEVEHRQLSQPSLHLEANSNRPDLLELERHLLADQLTFVPRCVALSNMDGFHRDLLSVEGDPTLR